MRSERLYNIILGTHTTEKSVDVADKLNQVTFKVHKTATKLEIKKAIEKLFNVVVDAVRVVNVTGKTKNFRQSEGKRSDWKKAVVSLKDGHDINVAEFE